MNAQHRTRAPRASMSAALGVLLAAGVLVGATVAYACTDTSDSTAEPASSSSPIGTPTSSSSATTSPTTTTTSAEQGPDDDSTSGDNGGVTTYTASSGGVDLTVTVTDTGDRLTLTGRASGLDGSANYLSLLYPDGGCAKAQPTSGMTIDGAWESTGSGTQTLRAVYTGAAYDAVKDNVGSVSVRQVTSVTAGSGAFTASLKPIACGKPQ